MPYIPKGAVTSTIPKERIALIGPPGSGKTTSLLTFPELIVFDRDNKLPPGVTSIPAWNPDWADEVIGGRAKRTFKDTPNFRDATLMWLEHNHDKFEPEQTFALDSWSFLQDGNDLQVYAEDDAGADKAAAKGDSKNAFFFWGQKLKYSKQIMSILKNMRCRVVVTMHETVDRDEKGNLNGKIRPVMDGSYKDQLLGGFGFVWRMRGNVVATSSSGLKQQGVKRSDLKYFWQVAGDAVVDINNGHVLDRYIKKHGISNIEILVADDGTVTGGYKTIQKYYQEFLSSVGQNADAVKPQ